MITPQLLERMAQRIRDAAEGHASRNLAASAASLPLFDDRQRQLILTMLCVAYTAGGTNAVMMFEERFKELQKEHSR